MLGCILALPVPAPANLSTSDCVCWGKKMSLRALPKVFLYQRVITVTDGLRYAAQSSVAVDAIATRNTKEVNDHGQDACGSF